MTSAAGRRASVFLLILSAAAAGCDVPEPPELGYAETMRRVEEVVEGLRARGATVETKTFRDQNAYAVSLNGKKVDDEALRLLDGLGNVGVGELNLSGSTVTDEQMRLVGVVKPLYVLNLSDTSIGDQGLSHLKQKTIAELDVRGTKVTDEAIEAFKQRYRDDPAVHPFFKEIKVTK